MPFLIPLLALAAGILLGSSLNGDLWGMLPVVAGIIYYLFLLKRSSSPLKAFKLNSRHSIWMLLLFSGIGMLDSSFQKAPRFDNDFLQRVVAAEGEVRQGKSYASGDCLTVEVSRLIDSLGNSLPCRNLNLLLNTDGVSANTGDMLLFPAILEEIRDNPNRRPTGYADRLAREGINYHTYVNSDAIRFKGKRNGVRNASSRHRDQLVSALEYSSLDRQTIGFLTALLFGDRSFLTSETISTLSNSGVAHMISLSGMHIAIIMGLVMLLLYPLKFIGLHKSRLWMAIAAIWAYAYFSGLAPSTVRACVMATFVAGAFSLQRKNATGNALLAATFMILLLNPSAIFDVGLQLSFLCVASVIAFVNPLNPVNHRRRPKTYNLISALLLSMTTSVGTWPVVSYYFQKIPLLFLPMNLAFLPVLPAYMTGGLLYTLLLSFGIDSELLRSLLDGGYSLFLNAGEMIAGNGASTIPHKVELPVVFTWLGGLVLAGYALRRKKRSLSLSSAALLAASLILIPFTSRKDPDGLIFQKNYNEISMAVYENGVESIKTFPRNALSCMQKKDCVVFSLDCIPSKEELTEMFEKYADIKNRYLIIGSGFNQKGLSNLPLCDFFDKIILHSSLGRKTEQTLKQYAENEKLTSVYSLRESGPFEVLF
jgi:ComEC/Rec2-related protein